MVQFRSRQTVLITGAAGFIGRRVTQLLLSGGFRIVAVDDGSAGTLGHLKHLPQDQNLIFCQLDIRDRVALGSLVAENPPWGVVHLAARHFIPDCEEFPEETLSCNVMGTQSLIDVCASRPPDRFVFASTGDVYKPSVQPHKESDPLAPNGVYGCSKLLGEWLLRDQNCRLGRCITTNVRLFNIYGPQDSHRHLVPEIIAQMQCTSRLQLGDIKTMRDYVYVDDAAEAVVEVLLRSVGGVINIGTGCVTSGEDILQIISDLTGCKLQVSLDQNKCRRWARPVLHAANDRIKELLPSWPMTSLRDGLRLTIVQSL